MTSQEFKIKIAKENSIGFYLCFEDDSNPLRDYDKFLEFANNANEDDDLPDGISPWLPFEGYDLETLKELIEEHVTYLVSVMTEYEEGK